MADREDLPSPRVRARDAEIASTVRADLDSLPRLRGFRLRGMEMTRLETFIDAAFAFAISMLVIAANQVPDDIETLLGAFKNVPAFVASIVVLGIFWRGHWLWSRRYGLEDGIDLSQLGDAGDDPDLYLPVESDFWVDVVSLQRWSIRSCARAPDQRGSAGYFCDLRCRVYRHRTGDRAPESEGLAIAGAVAIECTGKIDHALRNSGMEPAGGRRGHFAAAGSDLADPRDRLEWLGVFLDGHSGAATFGLPEEKGGRKSRKGGYLIHSDVSVQQRELTREGRRTTFSDDLA
jgi:hypothetical protein